MIKIIQRSKLRLQERMFLTHPSVSQLFSQFCFLYGHSGDFLQLVFFRRRASSVINFTFVTEFFLTNYKANWY